MQYSDSVLFNECRGLNLCVIPGAYAIVGSAAILSGITRMTVCLAVMMFELTGGLEYLVPIIVAILASNWVADRMGIESLYELGIELNKFLFLDFKKEFQHSYIAADIYGDKKYKTLYTTGMTVKDINDLLETTDYHGFPLVASATDCSLHGFVSRAKLIDALHLTARSHQRNVTFGTKIRFCEDAQVHPAGDAAAAPNADELDYSAYVDASVLQVASDCSVARLLYLFKSLGARHVVISRFSRFEGLVTKKDLINFMRQVEHEEHEEEHELGQKQKTH